MICLLEDYSGNIRDLDKYDMFVRGLHKEHFCKMFV